MLLTGGDPLSLSTAKLETIIKQLRQIEHVQIIRIGTRVPVFNPYRIINDLESPKKIEEDLDFLFVDVEGEKIKINYKDIHYIEGARNYIIIATEKKKYITYMTMKIIEELLPKNKFLRVHKSWIIAITKITSLRGNSIVINFREDNKLIPIGISFRKSVLRKLKIN